MTGLKRLGRRDRRLQTPEAVRQSEATRQELDMQLAAFAALQELVQGLITTSEPSANG